jgi:hypothetical protein
MKKSTFLIACMIAGSLLLSGGEGNRPAEWQFLGEKPPGRNPTVFAKGLVSTEAFELVLSISPSGKEILFTRRTPVSDIRPMYVTATESGTIYATGNLQRGIYRARMMDGRYQLPERLPDEINGKNWAGHPYIAPDESYLVFDSNVDEEGTKHLFVSTRRPDGSWSPAEDLTDRLGFPSGSCPHVTFGGGYLFFSSHGDIYWVDGSVLLKRKRPFNQPISWTAWPEAQGLGQIAARRQTRAAQSETAFFYHPVRGARTQWGALAPSSRQTETKPEEGTRSPSGGSGLTRKDPGHTPTQKTTFST